MNSYGKLFRGHRNKSIQLFLRSYNPDKDRYFEVIKEARSEGLKQVIINSEIMTDILYATLNSEDGLILKVNMSDNTDEDVKDNIKAIIKKIKFNKLIFENLKKELEWAADSGSIDINSIDVYFSNKRYEIYSNGIIHGDNLDSIFEKIMKPVLEKYFYGK